MEIVGINDNGPSEESTVISQNQPETAANDPCLHSFSWNKASVLKLIQLHKEHEYLFNDPHYKKKSVWGMITMKMRKEEINCTCQQAENKWKSLTKKYRDVVDHNSKRGHINRKCPFYNELSLVYDYTSRLVDQGAVASSPSESSPGRNVKATVPIGKNDSIHQQIVAVVAQIPQHSPSEGLKRTIEEMTFTTGDSSLPHEEATVVEGHVPLLKKKKKYNHPSTERESDVNKILHMLRVINEDRKKTERLRMEQLEKMHQEKVSLFKELLTAITTNGKTNGCGCNCATSNSLDDS